MEFSSLYGPAVPELGWVPAPRYQLRRRRILHQLRNMEPGPVLEIGSGAGMLLQELAARGYQCTALERSAQARELISRISAKTGATIDVHDVPQAEWGKRFPLIMAFEVLEHIEDDLKAFKEWASWLCLGGTLLMSVPAHQRLWTVADEWAGHYRRYDKKGIFQLVNNAGLSIDHFEYLGFPFGNITEKLQARGIQSNSRSAKRLDRVASNDRSGIDRGHVLRWYPAMKSAPGRAVMRCALAAQVIFKRLPLGNGFLLRASLR